MLQGGFHALEDPVVLAVDEDDVTIAKVQDLAEGLSMGQEKVFQEVPQPCPIAQGDVLPGTTGYVTEISEIEGFNTHWMS